jgi:hypothetical protein
LTNLDLTHSTTTNSDSFEVIMLDDE